MAGILAYRGSDLPDSVKTALENEKNYRAAIQNKLPLAVEGSGVPESVRKAAQAALEKGPRGAAPAAPSLATNPWLEGSTRVPEGLGKGIMGSVGKAAGALGRIAGPAAAAYTLVDEANKFAGPAKYQQIQTMMEEARTRQAMENDPELAERGQSTVDRIVGGAMQGVNALQPEPQPEDTGLTDEELNAQNPEDVMDAPLQSPMEAPAAAPEAAPAAAPAAPQPSPEEQAQAQEAERQTVEQGAVEGLRTGQVSRSELAGAVVDADAQRTGTELKPEEHKAKVAEELTQMRTMGDSDLAKYVSWAIMGVGLVASVMDKSGETGRYFADSYNKELDRQMQMGVMLNKNREAALDRQLKEREVTVKEKTGDSQVKVGEGNLAVNQGKLKNDTVKTGGILNKWDNDNKNAQAANATKRYGIDVGASTAIRGQDLRDQAAASARGTTERGQDMTQETAKLRTAADLSKARQRNETTLAAAQLRAKATEKAAKGESLTFKDSSGIIDSMDGTDAVGGKKLSKEAQAAVNVQFRNRMKADPTADPAGVVAELYKGINGKKSSGILGFGGKTSLPKYE